MNSDRKYHVSIGNGHCEIVQFFCDTVDEARVEFRKTAPYREEAAQLYCNIRKRGITGNYTLSHVKPFKLQAFYKVDVL